MSELSSITLDDLVEVTQPGTDMKVDVNFPFSSAFPATTGNELDGGHSVVYFEIDPGKELATHEDSPEELIVCLQGSDVEAWVGDAEDEIEGGDLVVVPPMAPHGFRNRGDGTARIFSDSTVVSEFEEPLEPIGESVVTA